MESQQSVIALEGLIKVASSHLAENIVSKIEVQ
jgi:hypothetical protein